MTLQGITMMTHAELQVTLLSIESLIQPEVVKPFELSRKPLLDVLGQLINECLVNSHILLSTTWSCAVEA